MIRFRCQSCGDILEVPDDAGGKNVLCPTCNVEQVAPRESVAGLDVATAEGSPGQVMTPAPTPVATAAPGAPAVMPGPVGYGQVPHGQDVSGVTIPVLISAIANMLWAVGWFSTCAFFFVGVPLLILGIFEFVLFSKANRLPAHELGRQAKTIGILEIISILGGNVVSMVCGILTLVNSGRYSEVPQQQG